MHVCSTSSSVISRLLHAEQGYAVSNEFVQADESTCTNVCHVSSSCIVSLDGVKVFDTKSDTMPVTTLAYASCIQTVGKVATDTSQMG